MSDTVQYLQAWIKNIAASKEKETKKKKTEYTASEGERRTRTPLVVSWSLSSGHTCGHFTPKRVRQMEKAAGDGVTQTELRS